MNKTTNPISIYVLTRNSPVSKGVAIFVNEFGIKMFDIVMLGNKGEEQDLLSIQLLDKILDKCKNYPMVDLHLSLYLSDAIKGKRIKIKDTELLARVNSQLLVMKNKVKITILTSRSVWNDEAKKILSKV